MDSREIFRQYIMGAMDCEDAINELQKLLKDVSTLSRLQEASKARYVIGFIRRHRQYEMRTASVKDLCLRNEAKRAC